MTFSVSRNILVDSGNLERSVLHRDLDAGIRVLNYPKFLH